MLKILDCQDIYSQANTDMLVVYGSGCSINDLTDVDINFLNKFDSMGFNWFHKSGIPTTFYLVREQANIKKRVDVEGGETVNEFVRLINQNPYDNSFLIVHDVSNHTPEAFPYHKRTELFEHHDGIIVQDIKLKKNEPGIKYWKKDLCETGVFHGRSTLNNVLHIAVSSGYKSILFVGIDLYDSRYFWLPKDKRRGAVSQKNKKESNTHTTAKSTLDLIKEVKKKHKLNMYSYNRESLLTDIIPSWL